MFHSPTLSSIVASESVAQIFDANLDIELVVADWVMGSCQLPRLHTGMLIHVNSLSPCGRKKR